MSSGNWFKTLKKAKSAKRKESKVSLPLKISSGWDEHHSRNVSAEFSNSRKNCILSEVIAATRIQTAFRAFQARRMLCRLRGIKRLEKRWGNCVTMQASTTLNHLHLWGNIQAQVHARRVSMVTEGRIRQKNLENQMKLEAKLHDLEVDWCGGSDTKEETLARIQQREEAAVKRERAMAYAFSHQWRANSGEKCLLNMCEMGKASWSWSWMDRWIAVRPWETRTSLPAPKQVGANKLSGKAAASGKLGLGSVKGGSSIRRSSYPPVAPKFRNEFRVEAAKLQSVALKKNQSMHGKPISS